jgi:signal-transduction protein with cAMP-binding, CBS, and nucleotidyltransferase domain
VTTHTPPRSTDEDPTVGLRELALFSGLPIDELDQLAAACDVCTAHPGQVIQAQDVPVRLWHLLVRGHAIVQRDGTPIGLLSRGDSWAEHSLLNHQCSPIAVVALSPVTMLTLRERAFFAIPEQHPVLAGRLVARSATSPDRLALPIYNALSHLNGGG